MGEMRKLPAGIRMGKATVHEIKHKDGRPPTRVINCGTLYRRPKDPNALMVPEKKKLVFPVTVIEALKRERAEKEAKSGEA